MANNSVNMLDLTQVTGLGANDLFLVVRDPTGVANAVTISSNNLFGNVTTKIVSNTEIQGTRFKFTSAPTTPATSIDVVKQGTMWYDSGYLYVAVADNTIKRVALTTF
jgi:hypothetical protein